MDSSFPHLLNERARLFGNLTRFDFVILGGVYLLLSQLQVGGILSLGISAAVYFLLKLAGRYLPKGYFKGLSRRSSLDWSYKLEDLL